MNDLIKRISDAKEMIERKPNQSTVDYTIYGVLTDCDIMLKSQQSEIERLQPKVGKWVTVMHLPQNKEFKRCTCCDDICMGWDGETGMDYDYCPYCGAKMN